MLPPTVGDPAPAFTLPDPVHGGPVALLEAPPRDTLLVFLRGTWCPYCRTQLRLLAESYPRLEAAGIRVVAVSCQSPAALRAYLSQTPLPFPLLADANRRVAMAWGVHYWLGWDGFHLARPALFVLDRGGRVAFAHVGRNMRDLPLTLLLEKFLGFVGDAG
jgi:peroxiredoxin